MQKNKGILTVVSGFSGAGKGTIMKALMQAHSETYALSISATTRAPRTGERDGIEYFFKSREAFEQMIADDALVEYAEYVGNYYGTPKAYVEDQMAQGRDVILEIELQGALKIKEKRPDTFLVYVMPPDARTLVDRLTNRGTETPEKVHERLTRALEEADEVAKYEFVVINDDLDRSAEELHQLIEVQHNKIDRNLEFISQVQRELKAYLKGEQ